MATITIIIETSANGDFAGAKLHPTGAGNWWKGGKPGPNRETIADSGGPPNDGLSPPPTPWDGQKAADATPVQMYYDEGPADPWEHAGIFLPDGTPMVYNDPPVPWDPGLHIQEPIYKPGDLQPEPQPFKLLPDEVPIPKLLERTSTEATDVDLETATQLAMVDPITGTGPWPIAGGPDIPDMPGGPDIPDMPGVPDIPDMPGGLDIPIFPFLF